MSNPYSHLSDKELMKLYQKGESMAFDVIYEQNKGLVYNYLMKRLSNPHAVDEVFQNVFMKFHKSRMNYDPKHELAKWIYTISRSELLDYLKKKKLDTVEFFEESHGKQTIVEDKFIDLDDYDSLSDKERSAIALRYYSDQDFSEISKSLSTSESNARKLISRGIGKIRKALLGGRDD